MYRKKIVTIAAVVAIGGASATALADSYDPELDIVVDLGTFTLEANGPAVVFEVTGPSNVVGFSFSGTASGVSGNSTWASDTQLSIVIDGSSPFRVGGLSTPRDLDWDFQGSGSTSDGFYSSGPHILFRDAPIPAGAAWTFSFAHDWLSEIADPITWTEAQLTVHRVIPAPGAVALLGLAGLAGTRRRRD